MRYLTSAAMRRAALTMVVLNGLVTVPVHAVAAPGTLAGTTILTGSRSGSILVRLPRAVDVVGNDFSTYSPHGRVTAAVLKKLGAWNAPYVSWTHHGYCAERGCEAVYPRGGGGPYIWAPGSEYGQNGRLPAGTYRLYLVTDGAPATFTFRFPGLPGTRRLTPRDPIRASIDVLTPTVADPPASPALFAGGSTRRVPDAGGLHALWAWKVVPVWGPPSATGVCVYDGAPPSGTATPAFQAPCEGGRGGLPPYFSGTTAIGSTPTPVGPGRFVTGIMSAWLLGGGHFSLGAYHDTPGPVTEAYLHELRLEF